MRFMIIVNATEMSAEGVLPDEERVRAALKANR
jgi:hypothetical protein